MQHERYTYMNTPLFSLAWRHWRKFRVCVFFKGIVYAGYIISGFVIDWEFEGVPRVKHALIVSVLY